MPATCTSEQDLAGNGNADSCSTLVVHAGRLYRHRRSQRDGARQERTTDARHLALFIFGGTDVKRFLWGWVLLCTLSVTLAFSQTASTSLRGTVKDPSGALVPGATITLLTRRIGKSFAATAKASGSMPSRRFLRPNTPSLLPPAGFGQQIKTAELLVNQPATSRLRAQHSEQHRHR